ncbi:MAG: hypothetical protein RL220_17 [Bacteroidota bacterium]
MNPRSVQIPFDIPGSPADGHFVFLNSNGSGSNYLAGGCEAELLVEQGSPDALIRIDKFVNEQKGKWILGYLSYDLRLAIERLSNQCSPPYPHPWVHLFVPQWVIRYENGTGEAWGNDADAKIYAVPDIVASNAVRPEARISKEEYISRVSSLRSHIQRGDIYEVNFCQEFHSSSPKLDPWKLYQNLNSISLAPMSVYASMGDLNIMSASPERYMKKSGGRLISQPIKGTIRRGVGEDDEIQRSLLANSEKERAENVMIVDLVRNDLSRVAKRGSVRVDELFGIHTFKTVHHMISTVSCEPQEGISFSDVLRATFPMGSMTGAPKISAMNLIDTHEAVARGLYSGTFGYIAPNGDFDFNVLIRSYIWHQQDGYLSCHAGGAITSLSDPHQEYDESMLKVDALLRASVM